MSFEEARVDSLLVRLGLARSRQQAQELISLGLVSHNNKLVIKSSEVFPIDTIGFDIKSHPLREYVSRGALKLKGAVEHTKIKISGKTILDIGISTGGFAEYLLKEGAGLVVGIDVGHGQLAEKLKLETKLKCIEGYNARQLTACDLKDRGLPISYDLIVIDVSFISVEHILPRCVEVLKPHGELLSLVKPQFEVGPEGLGKGGIVRDHGQYQVVEQKLRDVCKRINLTIQDYFESEIEGSDGNREFFIYAKKP